MVSKKQKLIILSVILILAGFGFAEEALASYCSTGTLVSTNLLSGKEVDSIDSFFASTTQPAGTSMYVQFATSTSGPWHDKDGNENATTSISAGSSTTTLSLGWEGPNFYYKMYFNANIAQDATPELDEIAVNYTLTSIFDFGSCTPGTDCWAYEKWATTTTFTDPSDTGNGEATAGDYTAISASDNSRWTTSLSPQTGQYDSQMYKFQISVPTSTINQLELKWEGFGEYQSGYNTTFYIWNYTSSTWDQIDQVDFTSTTDQELTGTTTAAGHIGGTGNNKVTVMTKTEEGVDTTAPEAITDLTAIDAGGGLATLQWTAPHEDGSIGGAVSQYDIRYSSSEITEGNWASSTTCGGTPPAPDDPGAAESFNCDTSASGTFWFAMKSRDEVPNWSGLSNSASTTVTNSCPFVYVWNGKEYEFVAETLTPFVVPEAEAPFLSVLPNLVSKDGKYKLKITEELYETSFLNNLFLLVVDHPLDTEVYPDMSGNIHTIKDKISANSCIDEEGEDCLDLFEENDNKFWNWGNEKYWRTHKNIELDAEGNLLSNDESDLYSWAILTFPKPKGAQLAKLVWHAKQHDSIGWAWKHFKDLLGYNHPELLQKYIDNGMLKDWFLNESAIIRLDVWDGKEWKHEYDLLEASASTKPGRFSHLVDVSKIPGNELKIRFKSIYGYRVIDSTKVDYSKDSTLIPYINVIPSYPEKAIINGKSVLGAVSKIDDQRVVIDQGKEMYLEFPEKYKFFSNAKRSYILVTTGYYFPKHDKKIDNPNTELAERLMTEPEFTPRYFVPRWFGDSETKFNEIEDKNFCSPYFPDSKRRCEFPLVMEKKINHWHSFSQYTIFDKIRIISQIIVILIILGLLILLIKKRKFKKVLLVLIILGTLLSLWVSLKVYKEFRAGKEPITKEVVQVKITAGRVSKLHCSLNTDYVELKLIFPIVSGKIYSDEGVNALLTAPLVNLAVNGTFNASTTASTTDGSYSFDLPSTSITSTVFTVYLDNSTSTAVTVNRYSGSGNMSGLDLYEDRIIVRHDDSGPITISDLAKYDSDDDNDILFTAASSTGVLTASSTSEFYVWSGDTFGNWGTGGVAGTTTLADVDINGTFIATSTQTISVSGNWDATTSATFTSASSTVEFTSTASGKTITTGGDHFYNLTFNGSGGVWTFQDTATTTNDLTITDGTASSTNNMSVFGGDVTGNGTLNWTGETFLVDGIGYFGGATAWTFNNLTFGNGSGVATTTASSTNSITVNGNLTVASNQTFTGSKEFTVKEDVTGGGTINLTGGTFEQRVEATQNFGSNSESADWTFNNFNFSNSSSSDLTITTNSGGTGSIIINGTLLVGTSTDSNNTILNNDSNDRDLDANGDVTVSSKGVLQASDSATFTVGGSWTNSGTFTNNSGEVTFDTTSTKTITAGGSDFYQLEFNGSGGEWTFQDAATSTATATVTAGTLVQAADYDLNLASFYLATSTVFTKASGSGLLIFESVNPIEITDNSTTTLSNKQNLGNVYIGASPATTNQHSDIVVDSLTINNGDTHNTRGYEIDCTGDITVYGTLNATDDKEGDGTIIYLGGDWLIVTSTSGIFTRSNDSEVIFDATASGKTIKDGGWPFNLLTFNGSGGGWLYQDSTSTAPATTTVQNGTSTFLNAKTGGVSVTGGELNVDWYLGIHVVNKDSTSTNVNTTGTDPITISEASSSTAIWRHNGIDWVGPVSSTSTDSGDSGKNPQPNNNLAIRIREYSKTSSTSTYYKYSLEISAQAGLTTYNYYTDYGNNYITSVSSTEGSGVDKCISEGWHRANPGTMWGSKDYDGLNESPDHGSWYVGMSSDLEFSVDSLSVDLGTLYSPNDWTATGTTILYATTSAANGYVITAWAANEGKLTTSTYEIIRWPYSNTTPAAWAGNCWQNTECGFGYTTDDNDLSGGASNRFATSTKYAGFATSSVSADPVADSAAPVPDGDQHTITYKVSVSKTQEAAEDYSTTIYYICTAQY